MYKILSVFDNSLIKANNDSLFMISHQTLGITRTCDNNPYDSDGSNYSDGGYDGKRTPQTIADLTYLNKDNYSHDDDTELSDDDLHGLRDPNINIYDTYPYSLMKNHKMSNKHLQDMFDAALAAAIQNSLES